MPRKLYLYTFVAALWSGLATTGELDMCLHFLQ